MNQLSRQCRYENGVFIFPGDQYELRLERVRLDHYGKLLGKATIRTADGLGYLGMDEGSLLSLQQSWIEVRSSYVKSFCQQVSLRRSRGRNMGELDGLSAKRVNNNIPFKCFAQIGQNHGNRLTAHVPLLG